MNKEQKITASMCPEFTEASTEELRVLIAYMETGETDPERLAEICKISKARARSSVVYWCDAKVIADKSESTITEEFESRIREGELQESPSSDVAGIIRNENLADMIAECAVILKRAALNTSEIKNLTALHTQYGISADYIMTLAAYLAEKHEAAGKRITVSKITNKALSIIDKGIDTTEALEEYIKRAESENAIEREFRRLFGIYDRTLTPSERTYFKKWSETFGYFTEIVGEAYDISVHATSKLSLSYIDKILTGWHEAGCRTVSECRRQRETDLAEKAKLSEEKKALAKAKKKDADKPRYGDFDINDAFQKALARSYGNDKETKT